MNGSGESAGSRSMYDISDGVTENALERADELLEWSRDVVRTGISGNGRSRIPEPLLEARSRVGRRSTIAWENLDVGTPTLGRSVVEWVSSKGSPKVSLF